MDLSGWLRFVSKSSTPDRSGILHCWQPAGLSVPHSKIKQPSSDGRAHRYPVELYHTIPDLPFFNDGFDLYRVFRNPGAFWQHHTTLTHALSENPAFFEFQTIVRSYHEKRHCSRYTETVPLFYRYVTGSSTFVEWKQSFNWTIVFLPGSLFTFTP